MPVVMFFVPPARRDGLSYTAGQPSAERVAVAAVLADLDSRPVPRSAAGRRGRRPARDRDRADGGLDERQIGGQTGDVLGAIEQISEIVILLVALR